MGDSEQDEDASATPSPPPPQTLGQALRNARLAQELTVEQISAELRIETRQLNHLENDRLEQIGPPVFVKGYLKQYGPRLGLDIRDLLALYYKQTTPADVQIKPSRTIKLRDERQITSWVVAAVVLLTVAVGLAVWWWNGGSLAGVRPAARTTAPAAAASVAGAPQPSRATTEAAREPQSSPVSEPPVAEAADAGPAPASETPREQSAAARDGADEAPAEPSFTVPLVFTFDAESWAEVTDGRGARLVYGLNAAGRTVRVRGEPPFTVVLGNAGSVRLLVDGEPYDMPKPSRQDNLARFSVGLAEE